MLQEVKSKDERSVKEIMLEIGVNAKQAARQLETASAERKHAALIGAADAVRRRMDDILGANALDMAKAEEDVMTPAFKDRLKLNRERVEGIITGLRAVAELPDPVGATIAEWDRPNGLRIARVRTPLGVIGVIYESRPNVTADAGALCLMAGNAVILRGGSDSFHSSRAIHAALVDGLKSANLPAEAIQIVPTTDRAAVGLMLSGLDGAVDVIVPRGGKGLVGRVQAEARVPVFAHLEGICHVYVHENADIEMAKDIAINAKMRRTGICGAAETLLIDRSIAATALPEMSGALRAAGCALRGDEAARSILPDIESATEDDWSTEYLDAIISVRVVDGLEQAVKHIATHGSSHTETIVTNDERAADRFLSRVNSAIVMHNASTQFADGGEFGMGAEIGIATGKMHARGPVGIEQLTSFKYVVRGTGQIRP